MEEGYKDEGRRTIQMNRWSVSGGWHFILALGKRALSRLPIRFPLLSPSSVSPSPRDRTITSFLFSFNYRCQGVTAPPPLPLTFSLFLTFLHYSFIYSNYPHHVNLSLPLISPSPNISFNVSIKIIPCGYNFLRSIFFDESKRGDANYPRNWAQQLVHTTFYLYIYRRRFPIYEIARLASHSTRGFRFLEVRGVRTLTSFPVRPRHIPRCFQRFAYSAVRQRGRVSRCRDPAVKETRKIRR